jgi:hypothetical protein
MFLRNAGIYLRVYTTTKPRRTALAALIHRKEKSDSTPDQQHASISNFLVAAEPELRKKAK